MNNIVQHSRIARTARAVLAGSVLLRPVRAIMPRVAAVWHNLGTADAYIPRATGPEHVPAALKGIALHSWFLGTPLKWADKASAAAQSSAALRTWRQASEEIESLPPAAVFRFLGVMTSSAVATHALVLVFIPANVRPAMPWYMGALVVGLGVLLVARADAVGRAWSAWRQR